MPDGNHMEADRWLLDRVRVGNRFRKNLGDLRPLCRSMQDLGLLHPIVIQPDGTLIAGRRRLEAARMLAWESIPVRVLNLDNALRAEHDENTVRQDFLPTEAVAIARALAPDVATPAGRPHILNGANLAPLKSDRGKTRDKVAAFTGMGHTSLDKAEAVVKAAEADPGRYGPLAEEMDRTRRVHGAYKRLRRAQQAEALAGSPPPLPTGPFPVLVADPPWAYYKRPEDPSHRGALPYPEMSLDEIRALPVGELASADAVLWLWTTNAHMPDAFTVLDAWGFTHKTILTWVKDRMGLGDWLRGQTEHCLLAVRGRPVTLLTNQTTVIHGPVREHSRKPESFYDLVEALCPGSKVELFARAPREGWAAHGDQTGRFAIDDRVAAGTQRGTAGGRVAPEAGLARHSQL